MKPPSPSHPGTFSPGDRVLVVDGTFAGQRGLVLSLDEARTLWANGGGEVPPYKVIPGWVCVAITVFSRTVPVVLLETHLSTDPAC